jgi:hypothetical protein
MKILYVNLYEGVPTFNKSFRLVINVCENWVLITREIFNTWGVWKTWQDRSVNIPIKYIGKVMDTLEIGLESEIEMLEKH